MFFFDPTSALHLFLGGILAGCLLLVITILKTRARVLALQHSQPLDAPADLDPIHLAYLARDQAGRREILEVDQLLGQWPHARKERPRGPVVVSTPLSPHGHSPSAVARPVPEELVEPPSVAECRATLKKLDLLADERHSSASWWAKGVAIALFVMCTFALVVAAQHHQGQAKQDPRGGTPFFLLAIAGVWALACASLANDGDIPLRNRRGDHVLAMAQAEGRHLRPGAVPWTELEPEEFCRSVALFGLHAWANEYPWKDLYARLNPPADSGG